MGKSSGSSELTLGKCAFALMRESIFINRLYLPYIMTGFLLSKRFLVSGKYPDNSILMNVMNFNIYFERPLIAFSLRRSVPTSPSVCRLVSIYITSDLLLVRMDMLFSAIAY